MAALTHVCMWSDDKGWVHITAEEASELHPGGKVSACSCLFMGELCGQYVTLTDGKINRRYFKHSLAEKDKDCPERTFGPGCSIHHNPQEHELPIRIQLRGKSSFFFELGLVRAPISTLSKDFCLVIKPKGVHNYSRKYRKERLQYDDITYLDIGDHPFASYLLEFKNGNDQLRAFWPREVRGIEPNGTLFEKSSGKKLVTDADVEMQKEYYLLVRDGFELPSGDICMKLVLQKRINFEFWKLYTVSARALSKKAARFFAQFHCRLTKEPASLYPIWPLYTEGKYILRHNQGTMYMMVHGNVENVMTFPSAGISPLASNDKVFKLYKISCHSIQQLISAVRTHVLQYTYLWQENLSQEGDVPGVSVTDLDGEGISSGETETLPRGRKLYVSSPFDGMLVIKSKNHVIEQRKIQANTKLSLDEISFGWSIQIFVGLDIVWQLDFEKKKTAVKDDEDALLQQLTSKHGAVIPVPHAARNILAGMRSYPKIYQWLQKCIRDGIMHEQAYRRLQSIYRKMNG